MKAPPIVPKLSHELTSNYHCNLTYSLNQHVLPLLSKLFKYFMSSSLISKSKMLKFSPILAFLTDFGIVMMLRWTWYFKTICAGVFLYFCARDLNLSLSRSLGSVGFALDLSGAPRGLYAVTVMPFEVQ